jgi:hypothetical protein
VGTKGGKSGQVPKVYEGAAGVDWGEEMSTVPKRIQRKRTKGWKMPPNTVYVGRPTKWGNPYRPGRFTPAQWCVFQFEKLLLANQKSSERFRLPIAELRGKDLACWCPLDQPCHADVLLEIANSNSVSICTPTALRTKRKDRSGDFNFKMR